MGERVDKNLLRLLVEFYTDMRALDADPDGDGKRVHRLIMADRDIREHLSERTEDEIPFMQFLEQTPDYKTITLKGGGKVMVLKNDKDAAP